MDTSTKDKTQNIFDPLKWGLPLDAIKQLGQCSKIKHESKCSIVYNRNTEKLTIKGAN